MRLIPIFCLIFCGELGTAGTVIDPTSRLQHLAVTCGDLVRVTHARVKPPLDRARARVIRAAAQVVGTVIEGSFANRLEQNLGALLNTQGRATDDPEVSAVGLKLNRGLRAVDPALARDFRIIYRGEDLRLFVDREATPTIFPARTPLLVGRSPTVVYGRVSDEFLSRLFAHASGS